MNFRISLVLLALAFAVSCAPEGDRRKGTQDTGGGSAQSSSVEQVNAAIDLALKLSSESEPKKNIFAQFWVDWARQKNSVLKNPIHIFPEFVEPINIAKFRTEEVFQKLKSPFLQALSKNKLERKPEGDCLTTSAGEHKDASVVDFNAGSDICFSVGNLRKVPPSALLNEVLSLALHEASHLGGAQEPEAKEWQVEFSKYFASRFGDLTVNTLRVDTLAAIKRIRAAIATELAIQETNPKTLGRDSQDIRQIADSLIDLPNFLDPLALELKLSPKAPALYPNYANSVLALTQKIKNTYTFKVVKVDGQDVVAFNIPRDKAVPILRDFSQHAEQIENNFLAFVQGERDIPSSCVLPTSDLDMRLFDKAAQRDLLPVALPTRECSVR